MPLGFDFEEELARQAALACSSENPNHANITSLGQAVFKDVIAKLGPLNTQSTGAMYYELHWNTMMAQNLFEYLFEKSEKCDEKQRPQHSYLYGVGQHLEFTVRVKHFMENSEMVLKCETMHPDGVTTEHSVRLSNVVKTS